MEAGLCLPSTLGAGARPLRSGSSYQHHFPLRCRRRAGIWPVSKAIRNFSNLAPRLCNKARPAAAPSLADQALLLIPSAIVARPSHHAPIFGIVPFSLSVSSEGMRALFVEAVWSGETVLQRCARYDSLPFDLCLVGLQYAQYDCNWDEARLTPKLTDVKYSHSFGHL